MVRITVDLMTEDHETLLRLAGDIGTDEAAAVRRAIRLAASIKTAERAGLRLSLRGNDQPQSEARDIIVVW